MPLFLNNIDLNSNELQNAVIQNLASDPGSGAEEGKVYFNTTAKELRVYNGTSWEAVGLNGVTADASEINILDGATLSTTELNYVDGVTSAIQTQLDSKAPLASPTFTGTVTLPNNTVELGTKTTGDYVASLVAGTGVTLTNNSGETATPTIAIGQAVATNSNVTFNDVTVSGNLTVSGTTTSINTETLTVDDNIIVLNNNATGAPSSNAGIEVERGDSTNVVIRWNESTDKWEFTEDGSTYQQFGSATTLGTVTTGTWNATAIGVAYGGTGATSASAARYNLGASAANGSATLPQKLSFDVGDGSATSYVLTHSLNTRDVTVQIAEKSSPYNVVIADVALTTVNTVTLTFATAPTNNQYRAVIIG